MRILTLATALAAATALSGCIDMGDDTGGMPSDPGPGNSAEAAARDACVRDTRAETGNGDVVVQSSSFSEAGTEVILLVGGTGTWRCIGYRNGTTAGITSMTNEGFLWAPPRAGPGEAPLLRVRPPIRAMFMASRLCTSAIALFAVLYVAALALGFIGTYGWSGQERDPLGWVFILPLGLPWTVLLPGGALWLAALAPLLNLAILAAICRHPKRRRP